MRHLGLEVHRLEKLMARQRGYSAAHQDADRQTGMHGYLLRYLYENQERDVFQRDIEKAFSISRSSVTVTLQLMEKNGLSNYKIFMRTFKKLYGSTPQKMRSNRKRHI